MFSSRSLLNLQPAVMDASSMDHHRPVGATLIPLLSFFAILLSIPPIVWHARNRNMGPAFLILWLIVLNSCNFLNALIWPQDNLNDWWKGKIYCDIQVRLIIGGTYGGLPGAVLCIMKALARVLDPKRTVVNSSPMDRRRQYVMDGLLCLGLPLLFMMTLYVVHAYRYYVVGVIGCDTPLDRSWVTFALLFIWPPIILIVSSYYALLVIYRLHHYRAQTAGLLHLHKTTRSRFLRLFIMATVVLLILLPVETYLLIFHAVDRSLGPLHPYSWSLVHDDWNVTVFLTSNMVPIYWNRYGWIVYGYIVFAFFGLGQDARSMYAGWLVSLGFGRLFPSLPQTLSGFGVERSEDSSTWFGSVSSKAKMLLSKHGSTPEWPINDPGFNNSPLRDRFRLSNLSSRSSNSDQGSIFDLPFHEPPHRKVQPEPARHRQPAWSLFASMPTLSRAIAGAQAPPRSRKSSQVMNSPFLESAQDVETGCLPRVPRTTMLRDGQSSRAGLSCEHPDKKIVNNP